LQLLRSKCSEVNPSSEDGFVESPFEQEVYDILCQHIDSKLIVPQQRIGGFRIDFIIQSSMKIPLIAIECDGKSYHSSNEAYAYDIFRQEQLEQLGLKVYRIWSTNWWRKSDEEIHKLLEFVAKTTSNIKTGVKEYPLIVEDEQILTSDEPLKFIGEKFSGHVEDNQISKVDVGMIVTIRDIMKDELLKVKITSIKNEENFTSPEMKILHRDSPLAKALFNKSVGDRCRLDGIEAYYDIVELQGERYSNSLVKGPIDDLSHKKHLDNEAILLVDDEPIFLDYLSAFLKEKGFNNTDRAENGQIAIEKLQSGRYKLVLLGLIMPILDGFGVLRFIKENLPLTKAVVISGKHDEATVSLVMELGAFACYNKPCNFDQLTLTVTSIMRKKV
jgi:CheY-like chemotaxis protein/very-short-patch-repair endonuclease